LENNDTLTELDLGYNKIDNIDVLKCLENNHSLTKLDLAVNKFIKNDIESVFNKVLEKNYSLISLCY
jgi:Leucine-rich repeat (LRR) protein